jgi:enoyl-[acyl-carrier protein] reductase II
MLGIRYPILQGGMAWVSDASLATAVSNAGGLGLIAAGNAPPDFVAAEIKKAKQLTDKPFGVNIMLLSPYAEEVVRVVCSEGVRVVTTGAGNPGKYMAAFKSQGITVIPVIPSAALAKRMEKMGADAVVAEGMESGGHIGKLTTMAIVPQVVDAVSVPVIAAGGIADGRGMAAALMLGADAVQIGTRFLVADECTVHERYKEMVLKAKDLDTVVTGRVTGHPVRALRNKLVRALEALDNLSGYTPETDARLAAVKRFEELGAGALRLAAVEGDVENGSVMAGQAAGLVKKRQTCAEIIEEMLAECVEITQGSAAIAAALKDPKKSVV